ncbi:MAG TPA: MATE family efflux transporter [Candidatus Faecousia intestinigallinarum]|nr:MATE family efflux transporter [Candidatus Faecousia intestinigallinarum]
MKKETNAPTLQENKMRTMPVGRLLTTMALPLVASMLVQALYNVVDSIYVSQISESAVTALSLAYPVQNLLIGFATGVAVGVNSLLSKSLGEGNQERANQAAGNGIVLMFAAVALFMLFGAFGSRPYFTMQSQVTETVEGGTSYIAICCLLSLGIFVEVLGERLLQASGKTVFTLYTQGAGAIINIVLDPVFIFGYFGIPAMGVAGAAVATVIGQWVAAIMAVFFNLKYNTDVRFNLSYWKLRKEVAKPILTVGIPSIIMMAIGSLMTFGMNQILQGFKNYGETATGVFGIYFKLQSFFFMPIFGLNNASISILAYNYGARQPKRITVTLKYSLAIALAVMLLGLLVFQVAPELLLGIFNPSDSFLEIGCNALRIISLSFPMAAVGIALSASFQAMGIGIYATITSLCRQLIVLLPVAYLMSLTRDVHAVWWAFPIAEVVSMLATIYFYFRLYRGKIKPLFAQAAQ